jgi:hypothetical protein
MLLHVVMPATELAYLKRYFDRYLAKKLPLHIHMPAAGRFAPLLYPKGRSLAIGVAAPAETGRLLRRHPVFRRGIH